MIFELCLHSCTVPDVLCVHVREYINTHFPVTCFRKWYVVSSQVNIHPEYSAELTSAAESHSDLLVLEQCPGQTNTSLRCHNGHVYTYPHILQVRILTSCFTLDILVVLLTRCVYTN